ncbi:MAG: YHS domain-containing protein [Candidatus Methylomirabilales bacterium]
MKTLIDPTCGCSLVRLGISKDKAVAYRYEGEEYYFCCQGCLDQFITDPQKHLRETGDLIVCPTCLTEKPLNLTKKLEFDGRDLYFCRCPICMEEFNKNPEYYIKRLEGIEDHPGTFKSACSPE